MRNICFLLGGFQGNGGIGRVTSMLAGSLAETEDFRITALSYVDTGRPNLYPVSEKITRKFFLNSYQSMGKLLLTGGERKLRSFLREYDIDVLIACGALFFPIAVRACKGTKTKCICWEHTDPNTGNDYRFQRLARSYGAKRSHCNVVLTKRAQKYYYAHFPKSKTLQIYNPIESKVLARAGEYDPESKKIISVGRLTYQKYFQMAVEIAEVILSGHPDWQWEIYGEGEDRKELEQMIAEKGLSAQMHLMGQVDDLYDRYGEYAMMVMTSRYEGFPMSLLEGMGNGLPLVSFDINTGPDEIIRDGESGYLIPAFDKQQMCSRILQLMEVQALRSRMSSENKAHCCEFAQDTILAQWKDLLESI